MGVLLLFCVSFLCRYLLHRFITWDFTQWNYGPLPLAQSSYDIRILQPVSQIVPDQVTCTALWNHAEG